MKITQIRRLGLLTVVSGLGLAVMAGVIFMVSGATGRYFLPVWLGSMAVLGLVAWLTIRRGKGLAARRRG